MHNRREVVLLGFASAVALGGLAGCAHGGGERPWLNTALSPRQRTDQLLRAMTLEEKFQQMVGEPGIVPELPQCFGGRHVPGLPRLGIPTLRISNGPVGVGQNDCVPVDRVPPGASAGASMMSPHSAKATALPSAIALAASFDRDVARQFGDVLGRECLNLALHVMEAPGLNLARMPHCGRNFEYFGEDPYLTGVMGVEQVRAVQAHGVIGMPKHFVANDQETDRKQVNTIIDDRVLHELYLLPFEMAVKQAETASLMSSYNSVNGVQMCEHRHLLTDVLRGQWGFEGYVQSDFFAVQSLSALRAGMDHEMPGFRTTIPGMLTWYTPENLRPALERGEIALDDIDTALARRYVQMFRLGIFDRPVTQTPIDIDGGAAIAARIGERGAVLLKNEGGLLPFDARSARRIALIGKADYVNAAVVGGGGSSQVIPHRTTPPLEGMQRALQRLGSRAEVSLTVVADDNANLAEAVIAARRADIVVVVAGALASEGEDLESLALPKAQDAMISALLRANRRTAVVLKDNAAPLLPWIDAAPAVLEVWFPGQEDGNIVAALLFGEANPSGKLPVTWPRRAEDLPAQAPEQWPGVLEGNVRRVEYSEGLNIGYRWFDARGIAPLFPFGYGLSYTRFAVTDVVVSAGSDRVRGPVRVTLNVENTGRRRGAETPQVYLRFPSAAGEPPKRLVAFTKVWLEPGEKRAVEMTIDPDAANHPFGVFDSAAQAWKIPPGEYQVMVGTSSADIVATATVMRA